MPLPTIFTDPEDSQLVVEAKKVVPDDEEFTYTERDVILYNLGIGATEQDLKFTYEGHEDFAALTTFGVVPQFRAGASVSQDWLPNFNPVSRTSLYTVCSCSMFSGGPCETCHGCYV